MTDITIIGTGNMAAALGARAVAAGRSLQILGRDPEKTKVFAEKLGSEVSVGEVGDAAEGQIVFLAVPFDAAKSIVASYGGELSGKIVVDISNPVNFETFDSLVVASDSSAAQEITALTDDTVDLVKAFNTTFAGPLGSGAVKDTPLDVFIAGDSTSAKATVAEFVTAAGLRAIDVGGLHHARELEGMQLLLMALQANPDYENFNWDTSLNVLP